MKELKTFCYRGTRILVGNEKRTMLNKMVEVLLENNFTEISIPVIQFEETFVNKVGEENQHMMFMFSDRAERKLCLAPEYTATIQTLAKQDFKYEKDVKLFYIQECFRGEKPQGGRYRQFTQLGVEILNPTDSELTSTYLKSLSLFLLAEVFRHKKFTFNEDVGRGLDYYLEGKGFEITCDELGAVKQLVGGGAYDGGIGFAIGIDRLLLLN